MTKKERIILFLLAGLNFTHILDFMIMMPLGNYLMPSFHISAKQFTFLVSAYSFSAAISGFIAAFVVDHFDRKKILLWSYAGFLLGTLACGIAPSYDLLFFARILAGIFGGIIGAQVFSIIADIFPYERRGVAMGSVMSAFAVASILGVPFSLYLTNIFHDDWHLPFLFVAGLGLILLLLIAKFIPAMDGHIKEAGQKDSPLKVITNVWESPAQRSALIFSCLLMMGHFLIIPFINPYLEFNKGFSRDLTPMIYLVGGSASLVAAIYLGRIADRKGKLPVFSISVFLSLFMVVIITRMPNVPFTIVLLFFAVWFVFATGRAVTAQAMISEVVKPEQRGSFMSFNGSVQQLGTSIASIVAGFVVWKDNTGKLHRYEWLGYLSIVVLLTSLVLGRYIFRKMDKTASEIKLERKMLPEAEAV
ncbi:MAG: MFS transporter [Chitinophagaceae bacterium]|nr:MFS transporter [Chitinophagaceae bacterium]